MSQEATKLATDYSNKIINIFREELLELTNTLKKDISIVTMGSFARREATQHSDVDYYILTKDELTDEEFESIKSIIDKVIIDNDIKMPAKSGAFDDEVIQIEEMKKNIGGFNDPTKKLTHRMLFLLESEWLYNESIYNELFDDLICLYVRKKITAHQLCRFLLNDIIRYYRTICIDFEFKATEDGKPWGIRNIKLMFARKLLYFSGILIIAETVQHTCDTKRKILKDMLQLTPIERIEKIGGVKAEKALSMYDEFIEKMSSEKLREVLTDTDEDREEHSEEFRVVKNMGHHFSWELSRLLNDVYDSSHPIHHAIKF